MGAASPPTPASASASKVNALKEEVEAAFEARLRGLGQRRPRRRARRAPFDLTLPGRLELAPRGHAHPIPHVRDDLLGDLPRARLRRSPAGPRSSSKRTTSPSSASRPITRRPTCRTASGSEPGRPAPHAHEQRADPRDDVATSRRSRSSAPGAVYRRDDDVTHSPMFHQIEGFLVDEQRELRRAEGRAHRVRRAPLRPGHAGALPPELLPVRRARRRGRRRLRLLQAAPTARAPAAASASTPAGSRSSAAG